MSSEQTEFKNGDNSGARMSYLLAVLAAFLIVGALVWAMKHYTTPPSLDTERAAERSKFLAEIRATEQQEMNNYGWVDQSKGIVRLTVDRAMELTIDAGKDPASARKDILKRVEKATFVPPKEPEKPSLFE